MSNWDQFGRPYPPSVPSSDTYAGYQHSSDELPPPAARDHWTYPAYGYPEVASSSRHHHPQTSSEIPDYYNLPYLETTEEISVGDYLAPAECSFDEIATTIEPPLADSGPVSVIDTASQNAHQDPENVHFTGIHQSPYRNHPPFMEHAR